MGRGSSRARGGDVGGLGETEEMHKDGEETHIMRLYIMTGIAGADSGVWRRISRVSTL